MADKTNNSSGFYGKGYDNVDDAAAAALMALGFQPRAYGQEYMGMIVQNPDDQKYYRTDFQTLGDRHSSSWKGYPGGKVMALVHTHPSPQVQDKYPMTDFSTTDASTADAMHVPNYLAAQHANGRPSDERKYTPGESQRIPHGATGDRFLAEFPIDEFKQFLARKLLGRAPDDPRGLTVTGDDMGHKPQ